MSRNKTARKYRISGRVQGVGFRYFVQTHATRLSLNGWALNLADGTVEVLAAGSEPALEEFEGLLRKGPKFADVRHVEVMEASLPAGNSFEIR